jgi:hypothetical protein
MSWFRPANEEARPRRGADVLALAQQSFASDATTSLRSRLIYLVWARCAAIDELNLRLAFLDLQIFVAGLNTHPTCWKYQAGADLRSSNATQ